MAMYEQGIDVLLAPTWDNSDEWVPTLRHIAKEGQIFVVGVTAFLRGSDVPRDLSDADEPLRRRRRLHVAWQHHDRGAGRRGPRRPADRRGRRRVGRARPVRIAAGRRMFDPTGHYARPDVLSLRRTEVGAPSAAD